MEENPQDEPKKEITFDAILFSTNFTNFNAIKVINQFFMSADCSDIYRADEFNVTFGHKLNFDNKIQKECKISYFEVSPMKKSVKLKETDCFVIFLDLEYKDSLSELNKILKNLQNLSKNDHNLYVVNFFTEEKNIISKIKEENIRDLLDRFGFNNYEIYKMNMNNPDEIIQTLDKITLETLKMKDLPDLENYEEGDHRSESICIIN